MKKILTTILVFLGLLTIGISIGANAAESSFKVTFKSESSDGTSKLSADAVKNEIDTSATTMVDEVSAFTPNEKVYKGKNGLKFGSSSAVGTLGVTFKQAYSVTKIVISAAKYGSDSSKVDVNNGEFEGSITSSTPEEFTYTLTSPKSLTGIDLKITGKRGYLKSFEVFYTSEAVTTYDITFDVNGGVLKESKDMLGIQVGQTKEVTLPTAADLEKTPYANQTTLTGWSAAGQSYEPGATVSVSVNTRFVAVYAAPETPISMANAILICQEVGNSNTEFMFSVEGVISEVKEESNNGHSVFITDGTNTMEAYRLKNAENLVVGDTIVVTGRLKTYNSIYEFDSNCTYKMVTSVAATNFVASETKTSLIVKYDGTLNPTDVDLRFGGIIAADAYNAGAKYGVLVVAGEKTLTSGKTEFASVADFIAANAGFKNVECTPAQVDGGYQFAWVISDMEGHYSDTLTGVMYMEYNGVLYICGAKTSSVKATIEQYLNSDLTDEQLEVLANLDGLCQ